MRKIIYTLAAVLAGAVCLPAQTLSFGEYMNRVYSGNIGYAGERLNIPIAEAEVRAARMFNDPSLSLEYANNSDWNIQMGQGASAELSKTISFGKRRAGIHLAESEKALAEALLDDYLRNLRAEAAMCWLDALLAVRMEEIEQQAYDNIRALADGDSLRMVRGKISEVDALQSRLEAGVAAQELLQARTEVRNSAVSLDVMMGGGGAQMPEIEGALRRPERIYSLESLLDQAVAERADLTAALRSVEVAERELKVIRRERNTDIDLALGANYNTRVRNEEAPAPRFTGFTVGVSVPLRLSNFNKGALQAGKLRAEQARKAYEQAEAEVRAEVLRAYNQYETACRRAEEYDRRLMSKAKEVLEGRIYAYHRGESSLLEVLDAQRTYNEVCRAYAESLYASMASQVELERSAGIWDIVL